MKKKLIGMVLAACIMSAGTVLAAPIGDNFDVSGSYTLENRTIHDNINTGNATDKANFSFFHHIIKVDITGKINDNTTAFARVTEDRRFGRSQDPLLKDGTSSFAWYGLKGKIGQLNYSAGRQSVSLGQGAIIGTGNLQGTTPMFDGIQLTGNAGKVALHVIGGKTTGGTAYGGAVTVPAKRWYGIEASQNINDSVSLGLSFANNETDHIRYSAANGHVQLSSKFGLGGEYVKSSAKTENQGYFVYGAYNFNDTDSFVIQYNHVETNAVDTWTSGIGVVTYTFWGNALKNYSGPTYVYVKKLSKNITFQTVYMDLKTKGYSGSDREIATGLIWTF